MPLHVWSTFAHHQEVNFDNFDLLMMSTCAQNMLRHEINLLKNNILCIKFVNY